MNPGRLTKRIEIRRPVTEVNRFREEETRYIDITKTRAEVRHDRGNRLEENGEIVHAYDVTFIVWLYVRDHVEENDIIMWEGKSYRIISLEPVEESKILYIKTATINE